MAIIHNSVYSKDIHNRLSFSKLKDNLACDVAIVGGGYTGLSSAIELKERGESFYNCYLKGNF